MANLKELRSRKKSVMATKKITSAMKMISAAKLRRAQDLAQAGRPYADLMAQMMTDIISKQEDLSSAPLLLRGNETSRTCLFIIATANRGLCGSFNASIVRLAKKRIAEALQEGRTVKILCIGKKGREQFKRDYEPLIIDVVNAYDKPRYADAADISCRLIEMFGAGEFDVCTIFYNKFLSALTQEVTEHRLIPFSPLPGEGNPEATSKVRIVSSYEYEPSKEQVLNNLLPKNLSVQIYRALLENAASEQGARMAAMDGATRNAEEMIHSLELRYNRSRQALITKELIEIISGAEAL